MKISSAIHKLKKIFAKHHSTSQDNTETTKQRPIFSNLNANMRLVKEAFGQSSDLSMRQFQCGEDGAITVLLIHIEGIVDNSLLTETVVKPLNTGQRHWQTPQDAFNEFKLRFFSGTQVKAVSSIDRLNHEIASGNCGILINGHPVGLSCNVKGGHERAIESPDTEPTIRGPKEGFVESLRTNTSMLRRRIASPYLRIEEQTIGDISNTKVAIAYIHGIAEQHTIQEVKKRLGRIKTDAIHEGGQIQEYITDNPYSIFPTIMRTERPDKVSGNLLEGRVAILVNGTPFVLIVPIHFTAFLSAPEDYYESYFFGSVLRFFRMLSFFTALSFPSLYVAIVTFHQELLPTGLILSIAAQREGVPFPAVVEAIIMELTFELLREAGTRLPRLVGPAISIIGALVLGDAAIRAGLVSPAMVVVVAFTGIASFSIPVFSLAISLRLLRFAFLIYAGAFGLFGVITGLAALLIHLCTLRSFGYPYLAPEAPVMLPDLQDSLIRVPWWKMNKRPKLLVAEQDRIRQSANLKPKLPARRPRKPR